MNLELRTNLTRFWLDSSYIYNLLVDFGSNWLECIRGNYNWFLVQMLCIFEVQEVLGMDLHGG